MNRPFVLGTRGSALALAQAALVKEALHGVDERLRIEVKEITTSGDGRSDFSTAYASGAGVKGLFTLEIEQALIKGSIDAAVHSCKDLPGQATPGLELRAVLKRADTADLFIGRQRFSDLPDGSMVGTGSVRRRRQILLLRPDLRVHDFRGNVPTRLEKLRSREDLHGIVLARAGLHRLGLDLSEWQVEVLPMLPAVGQGAIALQCRSGDHEIERLLDAINDKHTHVCIRAERELLRLLHGDCNLPLGVSTRLEGPVLSMQAMIFGEGDAAPREAMADGSVNEPEDLAANLFQQITL